MRVDSVGRVFCCSFDSGLVVRASRIRELPSGDYRGLLQVQDGDVPLHSSVANLSTASGRQAIVRSLNGSRDDWHSIIDSACGAIIGRLHQGERSVLVSSEDPAPSLSDLLKPILPVDQPAILFGRRGSTKSYLALLLAVLVGLPVEDNPFHWRTGKLHTPGLFVDNEASRATFTLRLKAVVKGLGVPPAEIRYRRLRGHLANEIESIQEEVMEHKIRFVILDSGGKAVSNPSDPAPVNELFNALAQLGVTTLTLGHMTKNELTREKSVFGSQFWESNARRVWFLERESSGSPYDFTTCLSCTKSNDSQMHPPTGMRVQITPSKSDPDIAEAIKFSPVDLKTSEFASKVPLRERMIDLLKRGPLQVSEIAEELREDPDTVRARLNGNKATFIKVGQGWGLKSNEQ